MTTTPEPGTTSLQEAADGLDAIDNLFDANQRLLAEVESLQAQLAAAQAERDSAYIAFANRASTTVNDAEREQLRAQLEQLDQANRTLSGQNTELGDENRVLQAQLEQQRTQTQAAKAVVLEAVRRELESAVHDGVLGLEHAVVIYAKLEIRLVASVAQDGDADSHG